MTSMKTYRYVMVLTFQTATDELANDIAHHVCRAVTNHGPKGVCSLAAEVLQETDDSDIIMRRQVWAR